MSDSVVIFVQTYFSLNFSMFQGEVLALGEFIVFIYSGQLSLLMNE